MKTYLRSKPKIGDMVYAAGCQRRAGGNGKMTSMCGRITAVQPPGPYATKVTVTRADGTSFEDVAHNLGCLRRFIKNQEHRFRAG